MFLSSTEDPLFTGCPSVPPEAVTAAPSHNFTGLSETRGYSKAPSERPLLRHQDAGKNFGSYKLEWKHLYYRAARFALKTRPGALEAVWIVVIDWSRVAGRDRRCLFVTLDSNEVSTSVLEPVNKFRGMRGCNFGVFRFCEVL